MGMPRASRTSAEPQAEVMARLPCLATRTPAAAATRAAAVEMLKLPLASPPVPQVSTNSERSKSLRGSWLAAMRRVLAKPAISAEVSPRAARAPRRAASSMSLAWPARMLSMSAEASERERVSRCSRILRSSFWIGIALLSLSNRVVIAAVGVTNRRL